jgi:hypothetical protein
MADLDNAGKQLKDLLLHQEREQKFIEEIYAKNPGVHPIKAMIMAGDYASAEQWGPYFERGEWDFEHTASMIGSYARMDWVLKMLELGKAKPEEIYPMLPDLWSGGGPDSTDKRFLELWRSAWDTNGQKMIVKAESPNGKFLLPEVLANNRKKLVTVFRGEDLTRIGRGISWSLDIEVAERFARGASNRVPTEGDVYVAKVHKKRILAYIAGRGESEVILDPMQLAVWPQVIERFRFRKNKEQTNGNKSQNENEGD